MELRGASRDVKSDAPGTLCAGIEDEQQEGNTNIEALRGSSQATASESVREGQGERIESEEGTEAMDVEAAASSVKLPDEGLPFSQQELSDIEQALIEDPSDEPSVVRKCSAGSGVGSSRDDASGRSDRTGASSRSPLVSPFGSKESSYVRRAIEAGLQLGDEGGHSGISNGQDARGDEFSASDMNMLYPTPLSLRTTPCPDAGERLFEDEVGANVPVLSDKDDRGMETPQGAFGTAGGCGSIVEDGDNEDLSAASEGGKDDCCMKACTSSCEEAEPGNQPKSGEAEPVSVRGSTALLPASDDSACNEVNAREDEREGSLALTRSPSESMRLEGREGQEVDEGKQLQEGEEETAASQKAWAFTALRGVAFRTAVSRAEKHKILDAAGKPLGLRQGQSVLAQPCQGLGEGWLRVSDARFTSLSERIYIPLRTVVGENLLVHVPLSNAGVPSKTEAGKAMHVHAGGGEGGGHEGDAPTGYGYRLGEGESRILAAIASKDAAGDSLSSFSLKEVEDGKGDIEEEGCSKDEDEKMNGAKEYVEVPERDDNAEEFLVGEGHDGGQSDCEGGPSTERDLVSVLQTEADATVGAAAASNPAATYVAREASGMGQGTGVCQGRREASGSGPAEKEEEPVWYALSLAENVCEGFGAKNLANATIDSPVAARAGIENLGEESDDVTDDLVMPEGFRVAGHDIGTDMGELMDAMQLDAPSSSQSQKSAGAAEVFADEGKRGSGPEALSTPRTTPQRKDISTPSLAAGAGAHEAPPAPSHVEAAPASLACQHCGREFVKRTGGMLSHIRACAKRAGGERVGAVQRTGLSPPRAHTPHQGPNGPMLAWLLFSSGQPAREGTLYPQ
jgi:hypothetical protein